MSLEECLSQLPKLFTKTQNNTVVLAKTGIHGQFAVCATTPTNDFYEERYDAAMLSKMGATDFKQYFAALTDAFNRHKCTASLSSEACTVEVPGCGRFDLQRSNSNGHAHILGNIISFSRLRVSKDPERLLEETASRANESIAKYKALEAEEHLLTETIAGCHDKITYNHARITELQSELANLEDIKKRTAAESGEAVEEDPTNDDDEVLSRVRNPMGKMDCKEFDAELLRSIKAQFMDFADGQIYDAEAAQFKYCSVVRPYTSSEFKMMAGKLPTEIQQQVYTILTRVDEWDYDVFELQTATCGSYLHEGLVTQPQGGSLFATAYALFHRYDFMRKFNLDEQIVLNWLSLVEAGMCGRLVGQWGGEAWRMREYDKYINIKKVINILFGVHTRTHTYRLPPQPVPQLHARCRRVAHHALHSVRWRADRGMRVFAGSPVHTQTHTHTHTHTEMQPGRRGRVCRSLRRNHPRL